MNRRRFLNNNTFKKGNKKMNSQMNQVESNVAMTVGNDFIQGLVNEGASVSAFLMNGIKLEGSIIKADSGAMVLKRGHSVQLIYCQSISTIQPNVEAKGMSEDVALLPSLGVSVEEEFINVLIESKNTVSIFLVSGIKLDGSILKSDNSGLVLEYNGRTQLVYKSAISTIHPR